MLVVVLVLLLLLLVLVLVLNVPIICSSCRSSFIVEMNVVVAYLVALMIKKVVVFNQSCDYISGYRRIFYTKFVIRLLRT
jgi:hypothetical protein